MLEDCIQETILEQNKLAAGSDRSVDDDTWIDLSPLIDKVVMNVVDKLKYKLSLLSAFDTCSENAPSFFKPISVCVSG